MYVLAIHTPIHEMCVQMNGTNTIILCVLCSMFYVLCSTYVAVYLFCGGWRSPGVSDLARS